MESTRAQKERQSRLQLPILWGMAAILLALILVCDLLIPQGIAVGAAYGVVILFSWLFPRHWHTVFLGGLATVLIGVDYAFTSFENIEPWLVITNRLISVGVVWLIVILVLVAKRRTEELDSANFRLEDLVNERTFELESQLDEIHKKGTQLREAHIKLLDAMKEVRKAEQKFRSIMESAPDAMIIADEEGKIHLLNDQVRKIFGYEDHELIGQPVELLMPKEFREQHPKHRKAFFDKPKSRPMGQGLELLGRNKYGREFPIEISLSPLSIDSHQWVSAAIRDITERKKSEAIMIRAKEDQARIKELEQFAYIASHDLQEPLRVVTNFIQLLELEYGQELDDKAREYITTAVNNTRRMKALIQGLLEYSRVGNKALQKEDVNLKELIGDIQQMLADQIKRTDATIDLEVGNVVLFGDPVQMAQLFQNLMSNAMKFHRENVAPKLKIEARRDDEYTVVKVIDNGIGIAPEQHRIVFKIFGRVNQRGQFEGNGIGMSIAKRIAERHGGSIEIESELGKGSTFEVRLRN